MLLSISLPQHIHSQWPQHDSPNNASFIIQSFLTLNYMHVTNECHKHAPLSCECENMTYTVTHFPTDLTSQCFQTFKILYPA